jgi:hypothetical protein
VIRYLSDRAAAYGMTLLTIACADCSLLATMDGFGGAQEGDAGGQDAEPMPDRWQRDEGGPEGAVGHADDGDPSDALSPSDAATDTVETESRVADDADANVSSPDAPRADADATTPEASPHDAGSGTISFCASLSPQPVFCEDFDEHPLPGVWTPSQVGGSLTLLRLASVSPPSSLDVHFWALGGGQPLDTALRVQFPLPAPPTTIAWEFQIQPIALDTTPNGAAVMASLDFADGANNRYSVQFTMFRVSSNAHLRLEEQSGFTDGGTSYAMHALPDPLANGWTRVQLVLTRLGPTTASVHVAYGAKTELDIPLQMNVNASMLHVTIGSSYETEPSSGWDTLYDNVIVNF